MSEEVKKVDTKVAAVEEVKAAGKKAAKAVKPVADKAAKKTKEVKDSVKKAATKVAAKATKVVSAPEVYVQFQGMEVDEQSVIARVKAQFVAEGHREGNIKSLKLYFKPEENAAYYVINDKVAGRVDLFA